MASYILGCNLSPILFAIYIASLYLKLRATGLGKKYYIFEMLHYQIMIEGISLLVGLIIAIILFADDLVLLAKTKADLDKLLSVCLKYFEDHSLSISRTKTKLMTNSLEGGEVTFIGDYVESPLTIENVVCFKYLGVQFNCRPYRLFSDFNATIVKKCESFLYNITSLTKCGPDRSYMALTLWRQIALPSILYGI